MYRFVSVFLATGALMAFTGCGTVFVNLTNDKIPVNPSGIYTLSFDGKLRQTNVVDGTVEAAVTVNGQTYPMQQSALAPNLWTFDYPLPEGQSTLRYFFSLSYDYVIEGVQKTTTKYSDIYRSDLINRYVVQLEAHRGPVGARIAVLGRGFTDLDSLVFANVEIPTTFESANSLSFTVPPIAAGASYPVVLQTGSGEIPVGNFRVDAGSLRVQPQTVQLSVGQRDFMIFAIDYPAPGDGLYIDVTTDIPSSLTMPEVVIPAGQRSVNIPLEGSATGTGTIYVTAAGFAEVQVPVIVR